VVFTSSPGPAKYTKPDLFGNIHPAFALQKAERLKSLAYKNDVTRMSSHTYMPEPEKHIPGHYLTNELFDTHKISHQRKTSFCIQTIIPDLSKYIYLMFKSNF